MILTALVVALWQASDKNLIEGPWYGIDSAKSPQSAISAPNGAAGYHIEIPDLGSAPTWEVFLAQPVSVPLKATDRLSFTFQARSQTASKVSAYVQLGKPPYTDAFTNTYTLSSEWKTYTLEGVAGQEFAAKAAVIGFHLNYGKGSVDLADFKLVRVPPRAPGSVVPLVPNGRFEAPLGADWTSSSKVTTVVDAKGPTFSKALHLEVEPTEGMQPWTYVVHAPTVARIDSGDAIVVKLWMRSATRNHVGVMVEKASEPFNKFVTGTYRLTPEWKEYVVAGVAPAAYSAGSASLTLFLGYDKGSVEVSDVRVLNMGSVSLASLKLPIDYFGGEKADDSWRAAALARIEKYRKGDLSVRVTHLGKPVPNAVVKVEQVSQAFHFGTAAPATLIVNPASTGGNFLKVLADNFNTVTFENDLKWFSLTPPDYNDVDKAVAWLKERGFVIRGHNVAWGSRTNLPKGLWEMSDDQIRAALVKRNEESVGRFRGVPYLWDVVNEAVTERELWDRLGWDEFVRMYERAHQADPKVKLAYNDYDITEEAATGTSHRTAAVKLVKTLQNKGLIDVFGLQCHLNLPLTTIPRVIEIVEELSKLGPELEVTEFDLGVFDDTFHAKYVADYLTAMYSQPKVSGFIMWGFWQGAHWRASEGGAMIRQDWSPRPAMTAWHDLVRRQWWTNYSSRTSSNGVSKGRAFYGTLQVTVLAGGKTKVKTVQLPVGKAGSVSIEL
jgi:endo-1,4-beta-xylanase